MSHELFRTTLAFESEGDKIHLLPAGPVVLARDARIFQVTNPQRAIDASGKDLLVDWEHSSEKYDGSTKAAGWVTDLELRANGIWGTVRWTPDGQRDVASKSYRYLSPVLEIDSETRDVMQILSVALTNKPALALAEIGDVSAYRARVRAACSERSVHVRFTESERESCRAYGFDDALIDRLEKFRASKPVVQSDRDRTLAALDARRAELVSAQSKAAAAKPSADAHARAACTRLGMSAEQIDWAVNYSADQRRRAEQR